MSRDKYVSPLSERYASKEMQYIFSPDMKFKTWRKLWIALAETEKELGLKDADGNPPKEAYSLQEVMYNPKVVAHSVQDAALGDGEGCLSVDRNVPGYVVRHARVTVEYFTKDGEKKRIKLKGYNSIVVQHEIDHTNGIMFYDRINPNNPFEIKEGLLILE